MECSVSNHSQGGLRHREVEQSRFYTNIIQTAAESSVNGASHLCIPLPSYALPQFSDRKSRQGEEGAGCLVPSYFVSFLLSQVISK